MQLKLKENILTYDIYFELRKSVDWNNWSKEQADSAIKKSYYTMVAYDGNKPIGMGRVVGDGMYLSIVDIVVRPEYQGEGVGSAIIKSMLDYIGNSTYEGSRVSVQLISEVGKEEYYIKQGFKLIPHEFCGPALRKIIYKD